MTRIQMIMEIIKVSNDYSFEDLKKLWYAEIKILHHAVIKEGKQDVYDLEEVENDK